MHDIFIMNSIYSILRMNKLTLVIGIVEIQNATELVLKFFARAKEVTGVSVYIT